MRGREREGVVGRRNLEVIYAEVTGRKTNRADDRQGGYVPFITYVVHIRKVVVAP